MKYNDDVVTLQSGNNQALCLPWTHVSLMNKLNMYKIYYKIQIKPIFLHTFQNIELLHLIGIKGR